MMNGRKSPLTQKQRRRRSYLLGLLRADGYAVDTPTRTIYVPVSETAHHYAAIALHDEFGFGL